MKEPIDICICFGYGEKSRAKWEICYCVIKFLPELFLSPKSNIQYEQYGNERATVEFLNENKIMQEILHMEFFLSYLLFSSSHFEIKIVRWVNKIYDTLHLL